MPRARVLSRQSDARGGTTRAGAGHVTAGARATRFRSVAIRSRASERRTRGARGRAHSFIHFRSVSASTFRGGARAVGTARIVDARARGERFGAARRVR